MNGSRRQSGARPGSRALSTEMWNAMLNGPFGGSRAGPAAVVAAGTPAARAKARIVTSIHRFHCRIGPGWQFTSFEWNDRTPLLSMNHAPGATGSVARLAQKAPIWRLVKYTATFDA